MHIKLNKMKTISIIIRFILYILISIGIYNETGIYTLIFVILITLYIELNNLLVKGLAKELKEDKNGAKKVSKWHDKLKEMQKRYE